MQAFYAECHYDQCHFAEYCGAINRTRQLKRTIKSDV